MTRFHLKRSLTRIIKWPVSGYLNRHGYKVVKASELFHFSDRTAVFENYLRFLLCIKKGDDFDQIASVAIKAKSQIGQDLFVLFQTKCKLGGFFVEFGATDGMGLSNTYLLEKEFEWEGILAEPAQIWHKDLFSNRSAHIETKCVWTTSNQKISFNETDAPMASTIPQFNDHDMHGETRKAGKVYEVETISLNDLLEKYSAPTLIDYLSIDTEGSELDILSSFNFDKYRFRVITVEHNWTENRQGISSLLSEKGYKQVFENVSQHDDWYIFADQNM